MKHISTTLILLTTSLSLLDCTGYRANSDTSNTSATTTAVAAKAKSTTNSSSDDIQMAQSLAQVMSTDTRSLLAIQSGSCVKIDYGLSTEKQTDQIYHVDCKEIDGTIEIIASKNGDDQAYDITTDLTYSDEADTSRVDNSFYGIKIAKDKTEHITKDFSETFKTKNSSFEISGTSDYNFTPDNKSEDPMSGKVEIESTVYFSKNEKDLRYFDVTSFGLHKSSCGFDSGVLSLTNADVTYQIKYSGCGKFQVTEINPTETASFY